MPATCHPIVVTCVAWLVCSLVAARVSPAQAPATTKGKSSFDVAIDALRKEFANHLKDPKQFPLRDQCDYFAKLRPPDVTTDAALAALATPLVGEPRMIAYVRWQLLSALPATLEDDAHVAKAVAVYRQAPLPLPRYGLKQSEQAKLDGALAGARKQDDVVLTLKLEALVKPVADANRQLLAYRNEWYRRLPKRPAVFAAALRDAQERQNAAAGAEDWVPTVIADVQTWVVNGTGDAKACAELADVIGQLRAQPAPPYYANAAIRQNKLVWVKQTDTIDPRKKLTHVHQLLVEQVQRAQQSATTKK